VAIAFGTADRDALFEVARRVIEGPDRFAQRLGFTVASAIIAAMHDLPPVPMPADASELPLAGGDRQGRGARIT
jgi:hypothetical protein